MKEPVGGIIAAEAASRTCSKRTLYESTLPLRAREYHDSSSILADEVFDSLHLVSTQAAIHNDDIGPLGGRTREVLDIG